MAVALPLLTGYLLTGLLWRGSRHFALRSWLAVGLGLGLTSCLSFVLMLVGVSPRASFAVELAAALGLGLVLSRTTGPRPDGHDTTGPPAPRWLVAVLVLGLVLACATFVALTLRHPHGGDADNWDSWAQWNLRARLVHRLGAAWAPAFSAEQGLAYTPHPDYPLFLPLSVARAWSLVGRETTVVPAVLAFLFTCATAGLVVSAVQVLRGRSHACLAGLTVVGLPLFVRLGAWQYADMPLAFLILATLVLFCLHDRSPDGHRGLLTLAGIATGLATWTKNEGWLFLVAVLLARWVAAGPGERSRQWRWYAAGLLPVLACVLVFKLQFASANDLVSGLGVRSTLHRVLDPSRLVTIVRVSLDQLIGSHAWTAAALVPCAVLLGLGPRPEDRSGLTTLAVALAVVVSGYLVVYVVTPLDLEWHVRTSVLRLVLHVWPSIVLGCFLAVEVRPGAARGE